MSPLRFPSRFVRTGIPQVVSRRRALALLICTAAALAARAPAAAWAEEAGRPNIVFILADDLGYECLGSYGSVSYKTPVLDRLAATGMRFEHCYAQPVCTPTRVELLTGRYNQRNYIRFGLLDPEAATFAQAFKQAGYATCVAGKWQLSGGFEGPRRFGFDEYLLWQLTVRESRYPNPALERNGEVLRYRNGEYGPDLASDYLCDFISRHRDQPFLAFYPMILTHWPFEPTPDSADWDPKAEGVLRGQGDPKYFGDMVAYMDKTVGKIIDHLESTGLREKTLVIFTGDNGTAVGVTSRLRDPKLGEVNVAGGKGKMTDAGTRVPLIVNWPGKVPAGRVTSDLVDFTDFFPTLLEAAGIERPKNIPLDGRSFYPQLRGEPGKPRPWIYSWYARDGGFEGTEFARDQRFKLYGDGRFFDVPADVLEQKPLDDGELEPAAASARDKLRQALAQYKNTRPESVAKQRNRPRQP